MKITVLSKIDHTIELTSKTDIEEKISTENEKSITKQKEGANYRDSNQL